MHTSESCPNRLVQEDGTVTKPSHNHLLEIEDLTAFGCQSLDELLSAEEMSHEQIARLTEIIDDRIDAPAAAEVGGIEK